MEPPAKRPRLSLTQGHGDEEEDELLYEPEEVSRLRDPGYQLEESRAFAAYKLKSTFEHIFAKYERDFTGIGDEIDLRTGKVVVDNGHIQNMRNERDVGPIDHEGEEDEGILLGEYVGSEAGSDEGDDDGHHEGDEGDEGDEEGEEHRILQGKRPTAHVHDTRTRVQSRSRRKTAPALQVGSRGGVVAPTRRVSQGRLSTSLSHTPFALPSSSSSSSSSFSSYDSWGWDQQEFVDPAWRAPPLRPPGSNDTFTSRFFNARYDFPAVDGSQSVWSSRRRDKDTTTWVAPPVRRMTPSMFRQSGPLQIRKPQFRKLLAPPPMDDDDEDELLGLGMDDGRGRIPATGLAAVSSKSTKKQTASQKGKKRLDKSKGTDPSASGADTAIDSIELTGDHQDKRDKATSKKKGGSSRVTKDTQARPAKNRRQTRVDQQKSGNTGKSKAARSGVSDAEQPDQTETRARRIEIVLPSRLLTPDGYTDYSDFASQPSSPVHNFSALPSPPLPESERASGSEKLTLLASDEVRPDAPREAPSVAQPMKETFTRHEMDKSYEFSGDEDGIPMCRLGRTKASEDQTLIKAAEMPFRLTRSQKRKYQELTKESYNDEEISDDLVTTATSAGMLDQEQPAVWAESPPPEPPAAAESEDQNVAPTVPTVHLFSLPLRTTRSAARRIQQEENATSKPKTVSPTSEPEVSERSREGDNEASFRYSPGLPSGLDCNEEIQDSEASTECSENGRLTSEDEDEAGAPTRAMSKSLTGPPEESQDTAVNDLPEEQQQKDQTRGQTSSPIIPVHAETSIEETQGPLEQEYATEHTPESQVEHPASLVSSPEDQMVGTAVEWLPTLPRGSEQVSTDGSSEREPPSERATEEITPSQRSSPSPIQGSVQGSAAIVSPASAAGQPESPQTPATADQGRQLEANDPSTPTAQKSLPHPLKPSSTLIRRGLLSLQIRPGDDDGPDEICPLSLSSPIKKPTRTSRASPGDTRVTPGSLLSSAQRRRSTVKPKRVVGSLTPRTPRTVHSTTFGRRTSHYGSSGAVAKQAGGTARFRIAREGFGGLSTPTRTRKEDRLGSPTGSIVQTPRGHMRRCGVDGFTCERDFCFTCLQG